MEIGLYPALSFHQLGRRTNQEDARFPDSDTPSPVCRTFIVCDGVGGMDKGEIASHTVAATLGAAMERFADPRDVFTAADFSEALGEAYDALARENTGESLGMATTMTMVHFHAGGAFAAHIGDSRIYQVRPGAGVIYRSDDHSLVNALVRAGNISPADAVNHPKGNVIMRCMGGLDADKRPPATVYDIADVRPGDYFLLCSDGVLHCIDDTGIAELLGSDRSDADKAAILADMSAPSSDNNTAILIHVAAVADADTVPCEVDLPAGTPTVPIHPLPPVATDVEPAVTLLQPPLLEFSLSVSTGHNPEEDVEIIDEDDIETEFDTDEDIDEEEYDDEDADEVLDDDDDDSDDGSDNDRRGLGNFIRRIFD